MSNPYETDKLVAEYLFFHYAGEGEVSRGLPVPREALDFPVRVVRELVDSTLPMRNALDLGCAVGRSSFELARIAQSVLGIDFSSAFIRAAETLKREGKLACHVPVEGERTEPFTARVPADIDASRIRFETGDAMDLRADIGGFDLVLAANLLCRLPEPAKFLQRLPDLLSPSGQLLLGTPFSWLPDHTAPEHWIGGRVETGPSWDALRKILEPHFELQLSKDLPFLIREHGRKFQYGISLGSRWIRRS
jgi:putative 4-mercaptohistidine N1-methyltranferase